MAVNATTLCLITQGLELLAKAHFKNPEQLISVLENNKEITLKILDPTSYNNTNTTNNKDFDFSGEDWAEQYKRYMAYIKTTQNKENN